MADHTFTDGLSNRALDTIDTVVATVNEKAIRPAVVASRAVVFGVIIAVMALTVLVLLCVGFVRITTVYLFDGKVWISYLVLGAIFCAGGTFAYTKRGVTARGRWLNAARSSSSVPGRPASPRPFTPPGPSSSLWSSRVSLPPTAINRAAS